MHKIVDFAKDVLGVKLHDGQAEVLDAYYSSGCPCWLLLAGRRSGKSLLSDVIACYEAVVPDFSEHLRENEERYVLIVSVRQASANLHIRNIAKLLKHNKQTRSMVKAQLSDCIELSNGVIILSLPASARAGRGYTASAVVFDELAHFVDTQGNSSADQVFDAFSPVVATFGEAGRLVITTTPMSRTGIVYDLFERANEGELLDFFVTHKDTKALNPKVSDRVIKNAYKRDPEAARTEYGAEFADPVAAYLSSEAIDQAIDPRLRRSEKSESGHTYVMAIDPATQRDRYAFAVMHKDGENMVLDYAQAIHPPVDITAAEDLLEDLNRRFRPTLIRCDTASTVQRLKIKISALDYTPFTRPMKLRIYGSLKENLNLGQLILYNDKELIDELKALQIRNGVDIAAPKSGRVTHDDLADCLALCVDALSSGNYGGVEIIKDPFANWPPEPNTTYNPRLGRGEWNTKPHPPGVTWRNCKHCSQGCDACVAELEAEGYYDKQDKERAFYRTLDLNPHKERERPQRTPRPVGEIRAENTSKLFWKAVKDKAAEEQ